ncbi:aspartate/glutamate racemase family protein [Pseudomonas sp. MS19]|uniref:aspartate/glutamate racemase family protein n=1 Tax=Pseudomonas sp. MS19 TaxID=2579939 RepID=UPI001562C770|nr:aspartate/glutamate racemase family protein [Pseudomonas sp. MS19]NRH26919.1 aspartate/glutamate racemase family protein [Pseudomonas sp. MS19]
MILQGGYNNYGIPIGVLSLESFFAKPEGHVRYAPTFDFPVLYKTVKGATIDRLIRCGDPELLEPFIQAARELEAEGVKAITGSCGFLALHQREIAKAVKIPVFMSSLIQVPLVAQMLSPERKIAVIVANSSALTQAHLQGAGITDQPVVIAGMQEQPQFSEVILQGRTNALDMQVFEDELFDVVERLLAENPDTGAIVLECTDLSHFAPKLHERFNLPVFDLTSLMRMVAATVQRTRA